MARGRWELKVKDLEDGEATKAMLGAFMMDSILALQKRVCQRVVVQPEWAGLVGNGTSQIDCGLNDSKLREHSQWVMSA